MGPERTSVYGESVESATKIHERLAGATLTRQIARLYSLRTRVKAGYAAFSWTRRESSDRLREAVQLIDSALVEKAAAISGWEAALRRGAEILEWLSDSNVNDDPRIKLIAAAAYQVAGYPARSRGLLAEVGSGTALDYFLSADFRTILRELPLHWLRSSSNVSEEGGFEGVLATELTRAFGVIAAGMRWGDESRLAASVEKMADAAAVMLHGGDDLEWLLAKLCGGTGDAFAMSSLRRHVEPLRAQLTEVGNEAIERYMRQAYWENRSIAWPSQAAGIKSILSNKNFALCTPTGSGKTSVAELAILQALFPSDGAPSAEWPMALYLVPSRALATEVERRLSRTVAKLATSVDITVTGLYGGTDWGVTDAWLTNDGPVVLICTYEKAEALLRFVGPLFARRVRLVVLDEAHFVNFGKGRAEASAEGNRPLRLESLMMRLLVRLDARTARFVALSAVAHGSEEAIAAWVSGSRGELPVKTSYRSTRQLVGRLVCGPRGYRIEYDMLDGMDLRLGTNSSQEDRPYVPTPLPQCPAVPQSVSITNDALVRPYLLWAALNLAAPDQNGRRGTVLISVAEKPGGYAESLLGLLGQWESSPRFPDFFHAPTTPSDTDLWRRCLDSCADYFGESSREYRLLSKGIVVHHGKMPGLMARLLVQVIDEGIVHVVIATSTLTDGVNLPFDTILVPRLDRYSGDVTSQEFSNLIGRAGRPGRALEGRSLVVVFDTQGVERRIARKIAETVSKYEAILSDISGLVGTSANSAKSPLAELMEDIWDQWVVLNKDGTEDKFFAWLESAAVADESDSPVMASLDALDGVLLPAVVEAESSTAINPGTALDLEAELGGLWKRSYATIASSEQEFLCEVFTKRAIALHERLLPDGDERRRLYHASLTPRNGRRFLSAYPGLHAILAEGANFARWDHTERLSYVTKVVTALSSVPAFSPRATSIVGGWPSVLGWWLDHANVTIRPTPAKVEVWQDYASQTFAYRAAWGIGSTLALISDELHNGELRETSLGEWEQTGLPWTAMWLKELFVWGTLEPVAAYLLSQGHAGTRRVAESEAARYYEHCGDLLISDTVGVLDPARIKKWANREFGRSKEKDQRIIPNIPSKLCMDFSGQSERLWRVVPAVEPSGITWFDVAGYALAKTDISDVPEIPGIEGYDFSLDAKRSFVIARPYL